MQTRCGATWLGILYAMGSLNVTSFDGKHL
jgi:hypothetical protein